MANPVIDSDGIIPNNIRADVMRHSIENKNLLNKKGSFYVGTGINYELSGSGYNNIAKTAALEIPSGSETGYILLTNVAKSYGWEYKSLDSIISSGSVTFAENSNNANNSMHIYVNNSSASSVAGGYKNIEVRTSISSSFNDNTVYLIVGA